MKARIRITMRRSTKKLLKKTASSATIWLKNVAGLVMQGLKKFWNDWNWVLPVVAVLLSAFTWYYKTSTETPARITNCEEKLTAHIAEADARLKKIEAEYNDVKLSLTRLEAMMNISLQDLSIMKGYITGEAHHK